MTEIKIRFDLTFNRRFVSAAGVLAIMFCAVPELESESVTLSTYYPAPSGVYTQMITTGNTYLARDTGNVGIGTATPANKLDVNGNTRVTGTITATSDITAGGAIYPDNSEIYFRPSAHIHSGWGNNAAGRAAIENSSDGDYDTLMILGRAGGLGLASSPAVPNRTIGMWDRVEVNGSQLTSGAIVAKQVCTDTPYGLGVTSCPSSTQYATYTSGIMAKKSFGTATTDNSGYMLCCTCPTIIRVGGACPAL